MKQQVSFSQFTDAFRDHDRHTQFSYEAKRALFDYLEEWGDDIGEEVELDVIALCCEFTEYDDLEEFHNNYDSSDYPDLETLRDHTIVIEIEGSQGFVIQDF